METDMTTFKSSVKKTCIAALVLLLAVLLSLSFGVESYADESENRIKSVTVNKSKTDLSFEISLSKDCVKNNKGASLYLFELLPYQSVEEINSLEPVKTFKPGSKVSFKIPFFNGNSNRLYSKFVVAEQIEDGLYNIITHEKYVDNPEIFAENKGDFPTRSSKKGLQIQLFSDAQQLGVQHTVVNIPINEYMLGENSNEAVSFLYNGQTFYLNKSKIDLLDHKVKIYSEAGINVYFNVILTTPGDNTHENILGFYCGVSDNAVLYALNTKNESAIRAYQAFMDYICERYTSPEYTYGFAPAIILGFEVNSGRIWNNSESFLLEESVKSYCTAFRIAYTAMKSHFSGGKVYISLANNFCASSSDLTVTADKLQDYPAKDFLNLFNTVIKSSGNIDFGVSINPYPSDPYLVKYWTDNYAEDSFNTPYITMKNIDVLTRYLSQTEFLYENEVRSVIIGEFGVSGNPSDEDSLSMQSSAYALAYYTVEQNKDIDAFIYHRQVDHSGETQYYGLWTNEEKSIVTPAAKKPIYNIFRYIDTKGSEAVTAKVESTVGSDVFFMYVKENEKYKQFNNRTVIDPVPAAVTDYEKGYKENILFDLTSGSLCDFYPTDNSDYIELKPFDSSKTMLYTELTGTPLLYSGIGNSSIEDGAFKNAKFIAFKIMAVAPSDCSSVNIMIHLQKNGSGEEDAVVYDGEVQIMPGEWQNISFNINEFVKKTNGDVDVLKLWLSVPGDSGSTEEYGFWVENVTLYHKNSVSVIGWIFIILFLIIIIIVAGYAALYFRAQYIRKKRRAERLKREQFQTMTIEQKRVNGQ